MYHSSYAPLCEADSGVPIKATTIKAGERVEGLLAIDLMDDYKVVFISNDDLVQLRANGRLQP